MFMFTMPYLVVGMVDCVCVGDCACVCVHACVCRDSE